MRVTCGGGCGARTAVHGRLVDSASLFGYSSAAWAPFANAGSTYATCPSGGGLFAGISDRLTGATYRGFDFSGHGFSAPAGTSISSVKWAGRLARDNCSWGQYIEPCRAKPRWSDCRPTSSARIAAGTHEAGRSPTRPDRDNPARTTRPVRSPRMLPRRRDAHAQRRGDDRGPDATVDRLERPAGERPLGERGERPASVRHHRTADTSGVQRVEATLGRSSFDHLGHHCNWASAAPCPSGSHLVAPLGIADLPDGVHTIASPPMTPPSTSVGVARRACGQHRAEPVVPAVVGGDAGAAPTSSSRHGPTRRTRWLQSSGSTGSSARAARGCVLRGEKLAGATREVGLRAPAPGLPPPFVARGRRRQPARGERCRGRSGSLRPRTPFSELRGHGRGRSAARGGEHVDRHSGVASGRSRCARPGRPRGTAWQPDSKGVT